tara:strand:- start:938 stop:1414 length:477 start_codon:yes stop_codon:yes gene_type:complete
MKAGRKRIPTKIKELQGTVEKSRLTKNEMQAELCQSIPPTPQWLSEIGAKEWLNVTTELFNKQMLYKVDLPLISAYANKMALHIETEMMLRDKGRIQVFKNDDGSIKYMQQVPYQSISDRALEQALKLASHFGLTPSSRTTIAQPNVVTNNTQYNFFD